jgi:hypothetical protein
VEIFAPDEIAIVHVMNRTVRRCFLMGEDPLTGRITNIVRLGVKSSSLSKRLCLESIC